MNRRWMMAVGLLLGGCLSSAPAAPPVRFFDATPTVAPAAVRARRVSVTSAGHITPDFAVRVGAREVAFDPEHRWLIEPVQMVAAVLRASGGSDAELSVRVECFELDVTQEPSAHLRLSLASAHRLHNDVVEVVVVAADRDPAAFAAAMAAALVKAGAAVAAAVGD